MFPQLLDGADFPARAVRVPGPVPADGTNQRAPEVPPVRLELTLRGV
jgi:hypothetical protein